MKNLPVNGQTLLDMRKRKKRPDGLVLISMLGFMRQHSNFQLCADPADVYDWTAIGGLDVEVFADKSVPLASLIRQLVAIADGVPEHMVLTFVEGPRVECGQSRHALQAYNPNVSRKLFDWFPMAVGPGHLADAFKVERHLWSALGNEIPIPFDAGEKRVVAKMQKELRRGNDD